MSGTLSPAGPKPRLPDGFTVRLHDDVAIGRLISRGTRVLRVHPTVRAALKGRSVTVSDLTSATVAERLLDLDLATPEPSPLRPYGLDDLTVVIPVLDDAKSVDRLLTNLVGQVTCIVVDDASRDPSQIAEVAVRHGATLIRLDCNRGPAAARNIGLARVTTPLVAFVDADVTITANGLADLLSCFADPGVVAAAPRILAKQGDRWFQRYERTVGSLDLGARPATVRGWSEVAYVPSACLVARAESIRDGFDESLRSGEDVDLVWRLLAAGHRIRYEPGVVALHDQRREVLPWAARQFFYGTSAAPLVERHGTLAAPAVLTPLQVALLVSLLVTRGRSRVVSVVLALLVAAASWRATSGERLLVRTRVAGAVVSMTLRQGVNLVVHHGAPASLASTLVSRQARRMVVAVGIVEGMAAWRRSDRTVSPWSFVAARRFSTAAYGCGVWWGAARTGVWRAVIPHVIRRNRGSS